MQNERGDGTSKDDFEILGPLPRKNIDTGMGVERVACLLQGVDNVYETDLLRPVIDVVATVSPRGYGAGNHEDDVRYRIIADHSRTAAIIIGDGVTPGNEGRGYVLRRLLRRIIRAAKLLGVEQPIMADLMVTVRDAMGPSYPELATDFDRINRIAVAEETAFNRTLAAGSRLFEEAAQTTKLGRQDDAERDRRLHPARHLRLPDRPDAGNGFRGRAFRRRARLPRADGRAAPPRQGRRRGAQARACRPDRLPRTRRRRPDRVHRIRRIEFRGKDSRDIRGRQAGARGGTRCSVRFGGAGRRARRDRAGPHAALRGVRRPDRRRGVHRAGRVGTARAAVTDVQKIAKTLFVHRVNVESGEFVEGDTITAAVDPKWRHGATQGHSGTHMVHAALRQVLGPQRRSGRLAEPAGLSAVRLQLAGRAHEEPAHRDRRS